MTVENTSALIPDERIMEKIYLIRGQKVMLDKDLAILFSVKAIRLREQVKRNPDKFPKHFMFQLTESEADLMVSQNAIPSKKHLGGTPKSHWLQGWVIEKSKIYIFTKKTMLLEITKKTGIAKVNAALKMLKAGKPFNAKKHCGKIRWDNDGISYQKKIRDEWD